MIKYHIDNIEVDKEINIQGWVFSSHGCISCEVNGENIIYTSTERPDVVDCYNDAVLMSGFKIVIPYTKKIILKFADVEGSVLEELSPYKIKKKRKNDKIKRYFGQFTFKNLIKLFKCFLKYGIRGTMNKIKYALNQSNLDNHTTINLYEKTVYTDEELAIERSTKFPVSPLISVIVPLYNTPKEFLKQMIESVMQQTYSNWELCLADGSDNQHEYVGEYCKNLAKDDQRIVYRYLDDNYGISGNTNECLHMAKGNYIALFDHDDVLHQAALFEVVSCINESGADFIYTDEITFTDNLENVFNPHFKPDFAIDNLRSNNYICHFSVFSKELYEKTGSFRKEYDGSQDYDMVLRLTEQAKEIRHIAKILYYWRAHANSVASDVSAKPYVIESAHKALEAHLKRVGLNGEVQDTIVPSMYKIKYELEGSPKVSILIPNKDHIDDLKKCISSIEKKSTYKNYEIIIIENNSIEKDTFKYYEKIKSSNIRIVYYEGGFNYSAINNLGFQHSTGDYILLLNNDVEVINCDWLEQMLMYCQRNDVGAVGAKLYYPDDTIQHAGLGIGLLTLAGHYHRYFPKEHPGYMGRLIYAQNVSAVTAACLMVKRCVYEEVDGLDETYEVAFNDVDFCMKIRKKGYLIVFNPYAELYHYESKSRGLDSSPDKRERFVGEVTRFQNKWKKELENGDPYYNVNLTLDREDFGVK